MLIVTVYTLKIYSEYYSSFIDQRKKILKCT